MNPPEPINDFCTALFETMALYGYTVREHVVKYIHDYPENRWFDSEFMADLVSDIQFSIADLREKNPVKALQFVTDITYLVDERSFHIYKRLYAQFFEVFSLDKVWASEDVEKDARYVFALYMLTSGCLWEKDNNVQKVVSDVLGVMFYPPQDRNFYRDAFAVALFGPVWHSLYVNEDLPDASYIDLILHQRPPFVGGAVNETLAIELPSSIAPG